MSQYGNLKHIVDLETLLGYKLSKIDFSDITTDVIQYSWGDESELVSWIKYQDDNQSSSGTFYTISGEEKIDIQPSKKYPLIWLATPVKGENGNDQIYFNNVRLIISCSTRPEWLNNQRWSEHIPMLQAIGDRVLEKLRGNLTFKRVDGTIEFDYENRPKFCVSETNSGQLKTLDTWDSFVLDTSLIASYKCKDEDYENFCNKLK